MFFKRSFPVIRRSRRQWISTSVQVYTDSAHMHALGVNLSDGGMCFFSVANMAIGSDVLVEFVPPQAEKAVRLPGKVKHRALYLYGIEFLPDDSADFTTSRPFLVPGATS